MQENLKVKVSLGNTKIGATPNISQPAGLSCAPGVACLHEGCYAVNTSRRYPNARDAWQYNFDLANEDIYQFADSLNEWLKKKRPPYFRFHVSGDFIDQIYYEALREVTIYNPDTKFLAFTKQFTLNFRQNDPDNFKIVWSMWPSMPLPTGYKLWPKSWLWEDPRRPKDLPYIFCPGNCETCSYCCWEKIDVDLPVVFSKH